MCCIGKKVIYHIIFQPTTDSITDVTDVISHLCVSTHHDVHTTLEQGPSLNTGFGALGGFRYPHGDLGTQCPKIRGTTRYIK